MASKSATEKRTDIQVLLSAAVAAAEDKKAEDIRILALDPSESGLTDYFLICSGNSDRQNVAITDEIEIRLKRDFGTYPNSVEGRRQGEWILMDYVDFIVHVFSAEKRAFYGLERLRKTATVVSIDELHNEIKSAISSTRKKAAPAKKAVVAKPVVAKKAAPAKKAVVKKAVPAKKAVAAKKLAPAKKAVTKKVAPGRKASAKKRAN
ncbi:ribosome silencing factor [Granulicella paludicola]|uniref:ribosome silencing factor n=1 Tax=Granulicella paludicola TaxID=474951 RepID=UPI0021E0B2D7|nr:ribosome silencing factor [Granulicella paludicola]